MSSCVWLPIENAMRPVGAFLAPAAVSAATAARVNARSVRNRIDLLRRLLAGTSTRVYTADRVAVPPRASSALQGRMWGYRHIGPHLGLGSAGAIEFPAHVARKTGRK